MPRGVWLKLYLAVHTRENNLFRRRRAPARPDNRIRHGCAHLRKPPLAALNPRIPAPAMNARLRAIESEFELLIRRHNGRVLSFNYDSTMAEGVRHRLSTQKEFRKNLPEVLQIPQNHYIKYSKHSFETFPRWSAGLRPGSCHLCSDCTSEHFTLNPSTTP
jgi:hypothetical protein